MVRSRLQGGSAEGPTASGFAAKTWRGARRQPRKNQTVDGTPSAIHARRQAEPFGAGRVGAKAAPGYYMAKQMIRMICKLGKLIDEDPAVRGKLRIVYLEDYCVSLSERLMPASEVSEQISLAGTEASGTGNMKFMLNGAITLGTLDGANVEIADAAGHENEIIFGMLTPEVNALKGMGYHPGAFINGDNTAMAVLDFLEKGWNGENFSEVTSNLRNADPYMVMADFKDYRRAQHDLQQLYRDKQKWNHMSLKNIANAGIFSADRSIMDYARDIWGAAPVK